ncbi:MAG: type II toxin-antitoxin system CcdA family antitoxin [Propionibacteriales bacterium]|nr:type II toxin-antitoxin system CcdA family antitoxin [Propionibacteriales bacterium]
MARVNVYLPDDLAQRAREAHLNVSAITQSAIARELARGASSQWLARVAALPPVGVEHADVVSAVSAARDEIAGNGDG